MERPAAAQPRLIREATSKQIDNDNVAIEWRQGYGYQFWRCRHNAYRGDGAFGQFCVVVPERIWWWPSPRNR